MFKVGLRFFFLSFPSAVLLLNLTVLFNCLLSCLKSANWCMAYSQHETELLEDSLALPGFASLSSKFASSEDEFVDSDDLANSRPRAQPAAAQNPPLTDAIRTGPAGSMKQEFRRRHTPYNWLNKMVCNFI